MTFRHQQEQPLIQVMDLKKAYDSEMINALDGISFDVFSGEVVAIAGPSGCGKTTLLNLMGGLDVPTSGNILVDGTDLALMKPASRFRVEMVGFVFQFHHLIPALTVLENVELPLEPLSLTKQQKRRRALDLLDAVGLGNKIFSRPAKISGGERQRAAIARALVNNPRILLADEPTGNLDSVTGEATIRFLLTLCRERNSTLVLVTHNPEIYTKAGRIIHMKNGLIEAIQTNTVSAQ